METFKTNVPYVFFSSDERQYTTWKV